MEIEEKINTVTESDFKTPFIIVLATGVVAGVVGGIISSSKINYIWPEAIPFGQYWGVIMIFGSLIGGIIGAVVAWLLLYGFVHLLSSFIGGHGDSKRIFKVGGYIFLILLIGNVFSAVAIPFMPETTIDLSGIEEEKAPDLGEIMEPMKEYQRSQGYLLHVIILAFFRVIAMMITVLAVEELYGLPRARAAVACGIPYIVYILYPVLTMAITLSL
ncbi:MAG: YIP1 family protein [Euryarchaeota archaeon]|nr:YIP1 family protein [Euryarchaeota archaeon]